MLIAFVLGLFLSLGRVAGLNVKGVNLNIWDVDDSCKPYLPLLQKAFDDAATMSAKALKDLKFVQQPRPQQDTKRTESLEWDRIARAVNNIFGFNPDEQGTNSENTFMQKVLGKSITIFYLFILNFCVQHSCWTSTWLTFACYQGFTIR